MRALTFSPETDQFTTADLPTPTLGKSDALIKVDACGLNPVDAKIRIWKSKLPHMDSSWVGGLDVSGHIVALGTEVKQWKIGERVLCHGNMFRPHGGFAEFTVQEAAMLIPHPDLSAEIAAATPCAGWTAWRALHDKLRIAERDSILIAGGSGGVGGFAIQIAAAAKVQTIITTCSAANRDYVTKLGATHIIDYTTEDVVARVAEITQQRGVAVGLDTVGPESDIVVANSLAFEGQMVELVAPTRPADYNDACMKGLSFHQLSLGAGHRHGAAAQAALLAAGTAFSSLLEAGKIGVPVLKSISLEQAAEELPNMLAKRTVGKIVLSFTPQK